VKNKTALPARAGLKMSDDEIRESVEQNQLKLQRERGTDITPMHEQPVGEVRGIVDFDDE